MQIFRTYFEIKKCHSLSHMVRHEVLKTGKLKKIMGDIFYKIIFVFLEVGFEIQFFV